MVEIEQYVACIEEAEGLKSVLRSARTGCGRQESTAEHSWRLALFALVMLRQFPALDTAKTLAMCLVHDMGELYSGDIPAPLQVEVGNRYAEERKGAQRVFSLLPETQAGEMLALWEEYSAGVSGEARLVKALDKAETILQHNQGANGPQFDYAFNLSYGKTLFEDNAVLQVLRAILDEKTAEKI